jgi:hypothetical protein
MHGKPCYNATSSIRNLTYGHTGMNLELYDEKPALKHGIKCFTAAVSKTVTQ